MIRLLFFIVVFLFAENCRAQRDGSVAGTVAFGDDTWAPNNAVAYQHLELLVLLFSEQLPTLAATHVKRSFSELDAERHCEDQRCLRVYLFDPSSDGTYQVLAAIAQRGAIRTSLANAESLALAIDWAWIWDANAARGTLSSASLRLAFEAPLLARKWDGLGEVDQHFGDTGPAAKVITGWLAAMAHPDESSLMEATEDPLRSRLQSIREEVGDEHRAMIWATYSELGLRTQLSRCQRANGIVNCEVRLLASDGGRWRSVVRQAEKEATWRIAVLQKIGLPDLPEAEVESEDGKR